jgi:hypothetical protein
LPNKGHNQISSLLSTLLDSNDQLTDSCDPTVEAYSSDQTVENSDKVNDGNFHDIPYKKKYLQSEETLRKHPIWRQQGFWASKYLESFVLFY